MTDTVAQAANAYSSGLLCLRQGQPEQALEHFDRSLQLVPRVAKVLYQRAFAYNLLGDSEKAISDCNDAIAADPPP